MIKSLIKKYFKFFSYFYSIAGYRIFLVVLLTFGVGLLDGLGLTMFLPLLEMVGSSGSASSDSLGKMAFVLDAVSNLGIDLNLSSILLLMLFFFTTKGVVRFFEGFYRLLVTQYFFKKLRVRGVTLLSGLEYNYFVKSNSGRIQNTLTSELEAVTGGFNNYLTVLQSLMMLLVYISLAYLSNAEFALLITAGGVLSNLAFRFLYKRTQALSRSLTKIKHGYQNLLIQTVAHFKYLKATGATKVLLNMTKKEIELMLQNGRKAGMYNLVLITIREPLIIAVVVIVIFVQVNYMGQQLSLIILSLLFFYRALNFVMNVQTQWNKILGSIGPIENVQEFFQELEINKTKSGNLNYKKFNESIIAGNLNFNYGDRKILSNCNFTFPRNQTFAFVGESGSGKTTLVNILAGLLRPKGGTIEIDNIPFTNLKLADYQKRIGYITQESVIFNDSIYNNVTFWEPKTPENYQRFLRAVEQASITDYINGLDEKEDSLLGNNGINLSGGQKQRISIARELYKDIDILIMDEATSALDSETELAIQQNIDALKGQYTIFIVAHRLSTIKNADQVILMDKGEIKAQGSYQQLLERSEKFQRMVSLQELVNS